MANFLPQSSSSKYQYVPYIKSDQHPSISSQDIKQNLNFDVNLLITNET